jgi:hypothetical protein
MEQPLGAELVGTEGTCCNIRLTFYCIIQTRKKTATVRAVKSEKLSLGDNCMTKSKPALIGIRQLTPSKHKSVGFMTFSSNLWSFVAFCFFVWFRLSGNERMRG